MNRVMSELLGNEEQAKMAASLLLTLPGAPFIYYGEEIGMRGEKPDEHIREPMLWYKNEGGGQTSWIEPRHDIGDDAPSVEAQIDDPDSLFNHYKTMIYLRRSLPALVHGDIEQSPLRESGIVAFKRSYNGEQLHVVHNLSRNELQLTLEEEESEYILFATDEDYPLENGVLVIPPFTTIILSN